ncbi:hypothetical protein SmJEL517_g03768 [Synchytrium microbalum]|uniref:Rrp15p-domain-containing protein n=1 Tax=Synchytrium microbalum TaxID=1806994 RepID=A0A507BX48_9FUNG|nr:uncharacterized protein SmJEL517_g03768 [Synchytrium microbalum]TPX33377.1 hypothetical protein SmJEL517_g03768 [Synchytrium microbalum]
MATRKRIRAINRDEDDSQIPSKRSRDTRRKEPQSVQDTTGKSEELNDHEDDDQSIMENGSETEDQHDEEEQDEYTIRAAKFADTINKLLQEDTAEGPTPILAKSKRIEKQLDREKRLESERRKVAHEKQEKSKEDTVRVVTVVTNDYEKRLRKIATGGVVKLFNAIRGAQKRVEKVKAKPEGKRANVASISKETFLSALATPEAPKAKTLAAAVSSAPNVSWLASDGMNEDHWDLEA